MLIFAKNKLEDTIYDKLSRGTNGIELHLDEDFLVQDNYWNEEIIRNVPIYVVHSPLMSGHDTCIDDANAKNTLYKTCDFANKIAIAQKHEILVVTHMGTSVKKMKTLGVYERVKKQVLSLVNNFDNVHIAIENVSRMHKNADGIYVPHEITFTDAALMATDINHERIGTCIDICHAMMDIKLTKTLRLHFGENVIKDNVELGGLEPLFKANQNTIKLIHFANCGGSGLGGGHGAPFTQKDINTVNDILDLYYKYQYKCPITIEVLESNYKFGENYTITKNTIEMCLEQRTKSSTLTNANL